METPRVRLGELLVRAGLISAVQLEEALAEQQRVGKRLGSLLVESGLVSETQVTQILSQQLSVPWVSLHHIDFSPELLALVPVDVVEKFCLIPIYVRRVRGLGDALYVAMDDPTNAQALTEVAQRSKLHVRAMIAPPSDIREALRAYYGVGRPVPSRPPAKPSPAAPVLEEDTEEEVKTGIHSSAELSAAAANEAVAPPEPAPPEHAVPVVSPEPVAPARPPEPAPSAPVAAEPVAMPAATDLAPALPEDDDEPVTRVHSRPSSSPLAAPPPKPSPASQRPTAPVAEASPPSTRAAREEAPASRGSRAFNAVAPAGQRARTAPQAAGSRRMIALTLLDGTTISVPAKDRKGAEPSSPQAAQPPVAGSDAPGEAPLTARDVVAALRAAAHGADASEVLGANARWEAMFAALLSLLLKKHLISDLEFVEEFKKL